MNLKKLLEERKKLGVQIRDMAESLGAEDREEENFTTDENTKWEQLNSRYDELTRKVEITKRAEEIGSDMEVRLEENERRGAEGPGREDRRGDEGAVPDPGLALQGWMRFGSILGVNSEQRAAVDHYGIDLNSNELRMRLPALAPRNYREALRRFENVRGEDRALSGVTGAAGGFTIPTTLMGRLEIAKLQFGGIYDTSEILRTSTGEDIPWPSSDDTSNTGEQIGENSAVSEQDIALKQTKWRSYPFSSKMVKVPHSLLRDSVINMEAVLGNMLGERLGRILNTKFTTGSGANTPYGIVERATTGKTTSASDAITISEVIDLEHSVDPAYRKGPSVGFMFHDSIVKYLRKLLDSDGRPLWQPSLQDGTPNKLNGRSTYINQDMDSSVASGNTTILFGDLSYYKIREVGTLRLKRLNERYAEYDQVAFIAFMDGDGNLLDAGTHPVKAMVQA